jgi:hypothetical protein
MQIVHCGVSNSPPQFWTVSHRMNLAVASRLQPEIFIAEREGVWSMETPSGQGVSCLSRRSFLFRNDPFPGNDDAEGYIDPENVFDPILYADKSHFA